ncbi:MAG: apolipoprotein N-acyltransferase [Chlamydiales bacterium]|nr:apolipoprotein N-acyltransferase [Chlamydiales bacterium]
MLPLPRANQIFLIVLSFIVMAFGQPAWVSWLGLISAVCSLALFWRAMLAIPRRLHRFIVATLWYTAVSCVYLSWMLSHHYIYIYAVWMVFSLLVGLQFGLFSLLVTRDRLLRRRFVVAGASIWTLLEWSRLFFMSGYTWNPMGLALTGSYYPLQLASLVGVFGLTFWATATNLLLLRIWVFGGARLSYSFLSLLVLFPYVYGFGHVVYHEKAQQGDQRHLTAILVQPHFPVESDGAFSTPENALTYVLNQWREVFELIEPHRGRTIDLIVFPEYLVPFGTYWPVYHLNTVRGLLASVFGPDAWEAMPEPSKPLADKATTLGGPQWFVSNAYIAQTIANLYNASVVSGLQDEDEGADGRFHSYSAAYHFCPTSGKQTRYEKQVLLPMGEYIPFSFCRDLAARYGIVASFTPGTTTKVLSCSKAKFGISICYEETFGDLMRHNRAQGAELLVNVTNDGWYPDSRLPQQHFDHARVRSVEMGIPLVRSANTGVTGAIDSLGRTVAVLGTGDDPTISAAGALVVDLPLYHYPTLYTHLGDRLILVFALMAVLFSYRLLFFTRSSQEVPVIILGTPKIC